MSKKKLEQNHDDELLKKQFELKKLRGKIPWEGDLEEMRTDPQWLQDWCDSQWEKHTDNRPLTTDN